MSAELSVGVLGFLLCGTAHLLAGRYPLCHSIATLIHRLREMFSHIQIIPQAGLLQFDFNASTRRTADINE